MSDESLLPIKVVFQRDEDYELPHSGGGPDHFFGEVTYDVRQHLADEIDAVKAYFAESFRAMRNVPAVAKLTLKQDAAAKSHRPIALFNENTCPIIGGNRLGELYVAVRPIGLDDLSHRVLTTNTQKVMANISALSGIKPYTRDDVLGPDPDRQLRPKKGKDGLVPLRFRLFRHNSEAVNAAIDVAFDRLVDANEIVGAKILDYADGIRIYRVPSVSRQKLLSLASFVGTQSISSFPAFRIVRSASNPLGAISAENFPPPEPGREYGLVGMIDSGTNPNNRLLQPWVAAREEHVPRSQQDNGHGTFVAGLIVHPRRLNHNHNSFPSVSSRIIDIVAIDKDGTIYEDDLLDIVDDSLINFPEAKVWNLSLALDDSPCSDHEFSLIGAAFDKRSKDHGVLFVNAAGNYTRRPFRTWPPQDGIGDDDRICPPADSICSLTVGSVAHLENNSTCVRRNEPSPFPRRGPAPAYVLKPELAAAGGNCDLHGSYYQTGVVSLEGAGNISENVGTSFACPLIATLAANVYRESNIGPGTVTPKLVKALLIHSAFLRSAPLDADLLKYIGLGHPLDLDQILNCTQSSATIILQVPVQPRPVFGKRPFPMPSCLAEPGDGFRAESNARFRGEVFMTLLYEPPLDRQFGIEYRHRLCHPAQGDRRRVYRPLSGNCRRGIGIRWRNLMGGILIRRLTPQQDSEQLLLVPVGASSGWIASGHQFAADHRQAQALRPHVEDHPQRSLRWRPPRRGVCVVGHRMPCDR
jgi:hypothetical protein